MFNNRGYYHNDSSPSWVSIATSVTATAVVATSSYWVYGLVTEYGWERALSYIWEGDPYPVQVRDRFHKLEQIRKTLNKKEKALAGLEEGLERARLDSVDGSDTAHVRQLWEKNITFKDLRTTLSLLSYDLDKLASGVDDVVSGDQAELKSKKKALSIRAVQMMERTDKLITFYKSE